MLPFGSRTVISCFRSVTMVNRPSTDLLDAEFARFFLGWKFFNDKEAKGFFMGISEKTICYVNHYFQNYFISFTLVSITEFIDRVIYFHFMFNFICIFIYSFLYLFIHFFSNSYADSIYFLSIVSSLVLIKPLKYTLNTFKLVMYEENDI